MIKIIIQKQHWLYTVLKLENSVINFLFLKYFVLLLGLKNLLKEFRKFTNVSIKIHWKNHKNKNKKLLNNSWKNIQYQQVRLLTDKIIETRINVILYTDPDPKIVKKNSGQIPPFSPTIHSFNLIKFQRRSRTSIFIVNVIITLVWT